MSDEIALLERSRLLRARIEDPTGAGPGSAPVDRPGPTVTEAVRTALLAAPPGSLVHRTLLSWVQPGLLSATAELAAAAQVRLSTEVTLQTSAGQIKVSGAGAESQRVEQAEATIAQAHTWPLSQMVVPGVATGVLALLALLAVVNSHPRGALLLVLATVIAAGFALNALRLRSQQERRRAELVDQLHRELGEGQRSARAAEQAQQDSALSAAELAAAVTARLQGLTRQPVRTAPI